MEVRLGYARDAARRLIKKHGITTAPVDVRKITASEGFSIEEMPWGSKISGTFAAARRCILVNSRHHEHRKRFTLAHELGHLLLCHKIERDTDTSFLTRPTSGTLWDDDESTEGAGSEYVVTSDPYEVEANEFAAELLMPRALVKKDWAKLQSVPRLAELYNVSQDAMAIAVVRVI